MNGWLVSRTTGAQNLISQVHVNKKLTMHFESIISNSFDLTFSGASSCALLCLFRLHGWSWCLRGVSSARLAGAIAPDSRSGQQG